MFRKLFAKSLAICKEFQRVCEEFEYELQRTRKHFLLAQKIEFDQITRKQFNIVLKDGVIWSNIRTLCKLFGTLCMKLFVRLQTICKEFAHLISFSVVCRRSLAYWRDAGAGHSAQPRAKHESGRLDLERRGTRLCEKEMAVPAQVTVC